MCSLKELVYIYQYLRPTYHIFFTVRNHGAVLFTMCILIYNNDAF